MDLEYDAWDFRKLDMDSQPPETRPSLEVAERTVTFRFRRRWRPSAASSAAIEGTEFVVFSPVLLPAAQNSEVPHSSGTAEASQCDASDRMVDLPQAIERVWAVLDSPKEAIRLQVRASCSAAASGSESSRAGLYLAPDAHAATAEGKLEVGVEEEVEVEVEGLGLGLGMRAPPVGPQPTGVSQASHGETVAKELGTDT